MRTISKFTVGLAAASLLVAGLAGCSAPTTTAESPAPTVEADPEPIASIPALDGVDTQVALDAGFVEALGTLGLTPGVTGTATLTDGVLSFPITGGNVDYYDPAEDYRPYVQGSIEHDGSGITLTAGTLDNDGGRIAAKAGDASVDATDFNNGSGNLTGGNAANTLKVVLYFVIQDLS